jgi:hypothetical protein
MYIDYYDIYREPWKNQKIEPLFLEMRSDTNPI